MKRALDYDVVKKDLEEFPDETVRARAKRLGCNQNTLGQYILDLRDPSRKVAKSKKIHEAMRKLKEDLEKFPSSSASERAARLGYAGPASIHYLLNRMGLATPTRKVKETEEFLNNLLQDVRKYPTHSTQQRAKRLKVSVSTIRKKLIYLSVIRVKEDLEKYPESTLSERAARLGYKLGTIQDAINKIE